MEFCVTTVSLLLCCQAESTCRETTTTNCRRSCRPDKNECVHTDCEGNVKWLWIQHNKSIKINPPTTLKCYAFAQMHAAFLDNCVMGMMERFLSLPVSHYNILHFKTRVYLQTEKERH